ncbi:MAG: phytanoyl-CoA dioxygenase family protein [Micromonosporaceae bacterium]
MAELARVKNDSDVDDVAETLERDGAVVIEELIDSDALTALWRDLGPELDACAYGKDGFVGIRTRRVSSLFDRTVHLAPLVTHGLFVESARKVMQKPVPMWLGRYRTEKIPSIQVSVTQAIQIDPGEGAQPLHRDDSLHLRRHPGPTSRVQLMLALSDYTTENGGTLVIPGSHHWDDERPPRREEAVPTEMSAGSGLIFLGGTYHGAGSNQADSPRTGLILGLDLGNLRQEENQYLAVSRESLRGYPEDVQRILGYDICPPGLGWYEMQNPHVVLEANATSS